MHLSEPCASRPGSPFHVGTWSSHCTSYLRSFTSPTTKRSSLRPSHHPSLSSGPNSKGVRFSLSCPYPGHLQVPWSPPSKPSSHQLQCKPWSWLPRIKPLTGPSWCLFCLCPPTSAPCPLPNSSLPVPSSCFSHTDSISAPGIATGPLHVLLLAAGLLTPV